MNWLNHLSARADNLCLCFLAILYQGSQANGPLLGDSLGFTLGSSQGFQWATNATGHMAYANWLYALHLIFPSYEPHQVFAWSSLAWSLATLLVLRQLFSAMALPVILRSAALLSLGLSFTFWRHSCQVEVYAANAFITSVACLWFYKWHIHRQSKWHIATAWLLGMALWVYIQFVLYLPFLVLWSVWAHQLRFHMHLLGLLAFGLPALALVVPPWLLHTNTLSSILFDNAFKDEVLTAQWQVLLKGLVLSLAYLLYNFGCVGIAMIAALWQGRRNQYQMGLATMALTIWLFAARYPVTDAHVFYLPAYIPLLVLLAQRMASYGQMPKRWMNWAALAMCCAQPMVYMITENVVSQLPQGQKLADDKWYKGGLEYYLWPGLAHAPTANELCHWLNDPSLDMAQYEEIEQNSRYLQSYCARHP
jgi:hypothetical protein